MPAASLPSVASAAPRRSPLAGYFATFIVLGVMLSVSGPLLGWVRHRAGVGIAASGVVLSGGSLGYIAGSFAAGRFYDRGRGHRLLLVWASVGVAAIAVVSGLTSLPSIVAAFVLLGLAGGVIDVGGNTLVVWSQPVERVGSAMNALHLCFGIGALITPLLVARSLIWNDSPIWVAAVAAIGVVVVAMLLRPTEVPRRREVAHADAVVGSDNRALALVCLFFFMYVGSEVTFGNWLPTYAEQVHLGGASAPALVTSVFWFGFASGRLAGIWLARRLTLVTMLLGSCVVAAFAVGVLVLFHGHTAIWLLTPLIGFALGPQYPTMMAYGDQRLRLSGSSTSKIVAASGCGGLLMPLLTGLLLDRRGADALPWTVAIALAITTAVALSVVLMRGGDQPALASSADLMPGHSAATIE